MPRTVVDLTGKEWRMGKAPNGASPDRADWSELDQVSEWLPAQVPGNIQADLVDAGRLGDPNLSFDAEAFRQVDNAHWWLVRDFGVQTGPGDRARLVLRGIDYIGDLFLNGHPLGRHEGMFSPVEREITHLLGSQNRLAVRLLGSRWLPRSRSTPWEKLLNRVEARFGGLPGAYPDRRDTLKCQMQFGWDFAPPLLTMGLWDDVFVAVSGSAFIRSVQATYRPSGHGVSGTLLLRLALAGTGQRLKIVARLEGETFSEPAHEIACSSEEGTQDYQVTLTLCVPQPRLWWPWDHGEPSLYRLTVELQDGDRLVDCHSQVIGLRLVQIEGYTLRVSGVPVFARGANWVPAGLFPGRVTADEYRSLIGAAHRAGMNMLRVWGGGLREKEAFYEECDRRGILVWQEFPLACAFVTRYPRSDAYLALVRDEARGIVRALRHHPCLALWCGGNEISPRRNAPVVSALRSAVADEDGTRPFLPASPHLGDHHNWRVWHNFQPPAHYRRDDALFVSELGLQAPPAVQPAHCLPAPGRGWPPGDDWVLRGAGLQKLWRYARPFLPPPVCDLARPAWQQVAPRCFVEASQQAQLHGLKIAVEHFRRRKAAGCGGILIWQLNDPWPAISWSLIPHSGEPKPAYWALHELFDPLAVSLAFPLRHYAPGDLFEAEAWAVNDAAQPRPGCELLVTLCDEHDRVLRRLGQAIDVAASSASVVGRIAWTLPEADRWLVTCSLTQRGEVVASSRQDLMSVDTIRPTLGQRLRAWLGDLLSRM